MKSRKTEKAFLYKAKNVQAVRKGMCSFPYSPLCKGAVIKKLNKHCDLVISDPKGEKLHEF